MKIKEENGIGLAGFVITILVILLIIAVVVCIYLIKNSKIEYKEVQNIVEKKEYNSPKSIENENTYENICGTYGFNKEFKCNESGDVIEPGGNFKLYLTKDGMYYYNKAQDINMGHSGYYTISENKIILHKIFEHGNDAALYTREINASGNNRSIELTINKDETITDSNSDQFNFGLNSATLKRESKEANYDITAEIDNAIKNDLFYVDPNLKIPEKFLDFLK